MPLSGYSKYDQKKTKQERNGVSHCSRVTLHTIMIKMLTHTNTCTLCKTQKNQPASNHPEQTQTPFNVEFTLK